MATVGRGKVILVTIVIVLGLEFLFWATQSSALFYVLYPGNVASLMITGGHGGTSFQELIAPLIGILVNMAAYLVLVSFARRL